MKATHDLVDPEFRFDPRKMSRVPRHKRHRAAPGDTDPRNCKVRITMHLDADIVEHFKRRAARPGALPYQTQINDALRDLMPGVNSKQDYSRLLADQRFIDAVAKRVLQTVR